MCEREREREKIQTDREREREKIQTDRERVREIERECIYVCTALHVLAYS